MSAYTLRENLGSWDPGAYEKAFGVSLPGTFHESP